MRSLLIGLVGAAVIGTGGYAAASGLDDAEPARTVSLPGATTGEGTTTTGTTTGTTTARTTTTGAGADISGPCDEAEHADDPRCTGGVTTGDRDDDHSGRGRGGDDDRDEDDDDEDRSGSNRGRG